MKKIYVTRPFLPPYEDMEPYLKQIWKNRILTNNGPFHTELEEKLAAFLGVPFVSLFSNGTLALITALKALGIEGEVITSPYSFVATTHALWWNNLSPVFTDIEPESFNIDPAKAEQAITSKTKAILPVHVYGNPCKLEEFERISRKYNLKIVYDAAHAFNVRQNNRSLLNYGDLSILSFHATKVFNTFEGGAIISHDAKMKHHIDNLKNFGFRGETTVEEPGINAKMNEFQAALGLLQLEYIEQAINDRKIISDTYGMLLNDIPGIKVPFYREEVSYNYSYYPIMINPDLYGKTRDWLYEKLKQHGYFGRRYFYPLINNLKPYRDLPSSSKSNLAIAENVAQQVICLPIYPGLDPEDIQNISSIICNKK